MSKTKKERKESASEDDDSSSSSSDSSSDDAEKKRKHTKNLKNKNRAKKKVGNTKKKNSKRATSESEDSSSDSSSSTSSSSSSSSQSETESNKKKRKQSKPKPEKTKISSPVREIKKPSIPREHTQQGRDYSERREPVHSEREHNAFRQIVGVSDGGEERRRRWSRDRRERSSDRRNSKERDFVERDRGREREHIGWRGGDQGVGRRGNFNNGNRGYIGGAGSNGREQKFVDRRNEKRDDRREDRRDDRRDERREDRKDDRRDDRNRIDDRGGQRDNWNNRGRYDKRRDRSRSPRDDIDRGQRDRRQSPHRQRPQNRQRQRRNSHGDNETYEWGKREDNDKHKKEPSIDPADKEKPNFALSGALTEDANKVNGVVVKYAEPPEARKPKRRWRLYPFKGETALPTLHIHRQSCFLVGRDRKVVDLAVDHPSCSKQHAALQYRLVPFQREDGTTGKRVRLYLIDLESANGTFLNNKKVDGRKYYELIEKDVIKFGFSTREYVLLHENSKEDQEDDDVDIKQEQADEPLEVPNP